MIFVYGNGCATAAYIGAKNADLIMWTSGRVDSSVVTYIVNDISFSKFSTRAFFCFDHFDPGQAKQNQSHRYEYDLLFEYTYQTFFNIYQTYIQIKFNKGLNKKTFDIAENEYIKQLNTLF